MAGTCTVRLLGGFAVEVAGGRIPDADWRHRRGADLVKLLALARGHRIHREQVADTLWPELSKDAAAANLRKAIYFARRALREEDAIAVVAGMVTLWPHGSLSVDVDEFEAAARSAPGVGDESEKAIALFAGDLLPEDRFAEWTEAHREHLRSRYIDLLKSAGRWEQILDVDPSDEEAHRALMQRYLAAGDRRAAIRQFARLREILRTDLGIGPTDETVRLFERALAVESHDVPAPEDRVRALIARALVSWGRQDLVGAEHLAEQARQLAEDHGLSPELGEACTVLGLVAWARGTWQDVFRTQASQIIQQAPDEAGFVLEGQLCLAEAALCGADSEALGALVRQLLGVAERAGSVHGQALMNLLIGETDMCSGRLADARQRLSHAVALYERVGGESGQAFALVHQAEVAAADGRPAEASQLLDRARPLAEQSELVSHLLVRFFAARISATSKTMQLSVAEEAERSLGHLTVCGPCSIGFWVAAAVAYAGAGELAKARKCLREAERLAGMWQGGPWLAATWEARAALRLAEGDRDQAAALLREAEALFRQSRRPLDAARCNAAALGLGHAVAIN